MVDIDRETAHDAAARELAKAIYPDTSLSDRVAAWINDLLQKMLKAGTALPGGWLAIVLLGLLVAAGLTVAVRIARRTMGSRRGDHLFGSRPMAAAEHRAKAEQAAAQSDWSSAIRQRVRAIGRQLEEDGVLNPVPGRTAGELAAEAGQALPAFSADLVAAATVFDDVTYGRRPGSELGYRLVSDLDDRLCRTQAGSGGAR